MSASYEALERLARERLPAAIAERWIKLLRPAVRLRHAAAGQPVVAQLGGNPSLHEDATWPEWDGHGPLTYVGSIDCEALAGIELQISLPRRGRLAFFYFDGQYDDAESLVIFQQPESLAGARVLYLPPGLNTTVRASPRGIKPYPHIDLSGDRVATFPNPGHPALLREFLQAGDDRRTFLDHPVNAEAFVKALWEFETGPMHQVGGFGTPVQGPMEYEVAQAALGGAADWHDPALEREAANWTLLAQIDSDNETDMMWGDAGVLYWMMRPADLEARRFEAASFTWQCH